VSFDLIRSVIKEAEPNLKNNTQIPVQRITQLLNRQERQGTPSFPLRFFALTLRSALLHAGVALAVNPM
jgi:hypothetical protein